MLLTRTVVKLFNVIQQSQAASTAAEESLKAQRGSGKPTLPAPSLAKGKKKGKQASETGARDGTSMYGYLRSASDIFFFSSSRKSRRFLE